MKIPVSFDPRRYQLEALRALENGCKLAIWCWARRAGKDFTAFGYGVKRAIEQPMNVVIVWPTKKQGYDNFWTAIENDGFKTLDHIPKHLIAGQTNSPTDMRVILKNGSTITLLGATDPDALRGANGQLYIFSEFVDIDSAAYDVVVPVVEVNGGQIIIQSTPKIDGISGGTFKMMFDDAIKEMERAAKEGRAPIEYASLITAHEYLSDGALERLRQKAILKYGNDFFFRQEFLCDWGQASSTSYYGSILQMLKEKGKVGRYPHDPALPTYTAWDLGMSDMFAVTFFQYVNKKPRIIDYYETNNTAYELMVRFIEAKPYNIAWHFIPHDGSVRDSDNIERIEKIRGFGLLNSSLLKREGKDSGINRVVENLHLTDFNEETTHALRRKLGLYKKKYNPHTGDYEGPEHKTESHAADTIKYMFKAIEDEFDKETGEFLYSPGMAQESYEGGLVSTPKPFAPLY